MAGRRAKFACSIDASLLGRIEQLRARTGESRSAMVSRALARLADDEYHAARVLRYIEAYREQPESADEIELATALARRVLARVPWDET
jgi:metal-responsive CopG/Arc/MetJ family transcriptional regulator